MHIGERIREVMHQRHRSAIWLASEISCERTNVYNIFSRADINTGVLRKISIALEYDFFKELSETSFPKKKKYNYKLSEKFCIFATEKIW